MLKTIEQSVRFFATARELYDIYLDPARHAAVTGSAVTISSKAGSKFTAFGGLLSGVTLFTRPGQLIVQRWRSNMFHDDDLDSILILRFIDDGKRGRIDLSHANVPEHDHAGVTKGWEKYYWKPLRAHLRQRAAAS